MARGKVDIRRLQELERVRNQGIANNQLSDMQRASGQALPDYGHYIYEDASVEPLGTQWLPTGPGGQQEKFPAPVQVQPNVYGPGSDPRWQTGKMDIDYGHDRVVSDPPSWASTYEDYGETQQHASATEGGEQTSFMSPHQRMVERFKNQRPETFFQDMRTDELLMYSRQLGNWASDTVFEGDPASYDYKAIHEELDVIDKELDARHERFKTYLDETRRLIARFGKEGGPKATIRPGKPGEGGSDRPKLDSWPPPPGTNLGGVTQDTRPQGGDPSQGGNMVQGDDGRWHPLPLG